jgi:hypothetical protein
MYNPQTPLQTSIAEATDACKRYKDHVANTYGAGSADGHTSYLLDQEDINALLQGQTDAGIRIYIGHDDKGKGPLVRLFMVGCKKGADGEYHDNQIEPQPAPEPAGQSNAKTMMKLSTTSFSEARLVSGRPCPSECGLYIFWF